MTEISEALSRPFGMERQVDVYLRGLAGEMPGIPVSADALEKLAQERMKGEAYDFIAGGAGSEATVRANRLAYERWSIVPRMLRDISRRDMSITLLGRTLPAPLLLAPVGVQGLVHPEAELATARAAASLGVPFILSTVGSSTIEQVADVMGNAPRWFQLYWSKDEELTASLVRRAERAGYEAIVVTVDNSIIGWRERDIQQAYLPFLLGEGVANYLSDPVFRDALAESPEANLQAAIQHWLGIFGKPALTWEDLRQLRAYTRLPLLIKGILHPDDARNALEYGLDGIIVSNHGGRQVDGAVSTLQILPDMVAAIDGRIPVLFDGGIRHGADAFKALALGANAILLGRLYIWALAIGGEAGVREMLLNFLTDMEMTLSLSGHTTWTTVDTMSVIQS